ncbi:hypothetical protein Pfo_005751 [Paulownia fortunei]|nr:hypothetical protein Pfo_005751 [Paulownia fortunei]
MNQCVPSWELDQYSVPINVHARSNSSSSLARDVPSLDYEVAELTWENGQLAMHGLGPSRVVNKPAATSSPTKYTTWEKPRAGGTLESIVNQATSHTHPKSAVDGGGDNVNELVPWLDHHRAMVNPSASITMTMDALVPCNNNIHRYDNNQENSTHVLESVPGIGTCVVGSCSGAAPAAGATDGSVRGGRVARVGICSCKANASVSESATCGGRESRQVTLDTCEREFGGGGLTSTSLWSPENTSSDKDYTRTSAEDHDSVCHSRSQRKTGDDRKKKGIGKSSVSTKSRAAAIHNQSERKRRDKINQRMKTLQKLVPNSSKTDKASMLDEVIEYLKQLQAQVHMMSRMNMQPMMLPLAMQQQLQISMMAPAMGMGMGMGVMDINTIGRAAGLPPVIPPAAAFMPMASWDIQGGDRLHSPAVMPDLLSAFLACQSQPMTIDAYSRLAALYQQFQQAPASGSKH